MANSDLDFRSSRLIHVASIGSTNEDLLARARAGERGPLWLRADRQTQGRGRLGRAWNSPVGNLHASLLILDPAAETRFLPQLAHVAAVALAETVAAMGAADGAFRLKWPNDLLFGTAKVAGILVEGTRAPGGVPACVIGWGVNCIHHPDDLPYATTDLSAACGRRITADAVFDGLRGAAETVLGAWGRGRNYHAIREAWLRHGLPIGTPVTVNGPVAPTAGRFEGLDDEGRFLLRTSAGLVTVEAGDINLHAETAAAVG